VRFLEEHDFRSCRVISHVRLATQGERALRNTQPFARELGGRMHVFAHNGKLSGVESHPELRLGRFRPLGETDSEHVFCALLARMEGLWEPGGLPELAARVEVFVELAATLRRLGPANLLYSDGEALFVHAHRRTQPDGEIRSPGLHLLCRSCAAGEGSLEAAGVSIATGPQQRQEVVLIASVPLTEEGWQPLAEGEVLACERGKVLVRRTAV
jgi:glutamine amidotransferase